MDKLKTLIAVIDAFSYGIASLKFIYIYILAKKYPPPLSPHTHKEIVGVDKFSFFGIFLNHLNSWKGVKCKFCNFKYVLLKRKIEG